jgi:hypothetical protein
LRSSTCRTGTAADNAIATIIFQRSCMIVGLMVLQQQCLLELNAQQQMQEGHGS